MSSTGSNSSSESAETTKPVLSPEDQAIVYSVNTHFQVIEKAIAFADAQMAWRAELERDHVITPDMARRRADAIDGLLAAVAALDGQ